MENHPNLLETLTEDQQLQVYELMAVSNIEDGNKAARLYIEASYDLNVFIAISKVNFTACYPKIF